MAEVAVGSVIDKLFQLVTKEAILLRGVHREVGELQRELESIQSFLKDTDAKAATEGDHVFDGVKTWVKQLREAAFRIEDVIDEYLRHVAKHPHHRVHGGFLRKVTHLIKNLKPRHEIANEIQVIKASVKKIKERSARYGGISTYLEQKSTITGGARNVRSNDPRMASLYLGEAEVVGIEAPRNELIGWLVEGPFASHRAVISVVGMGGIGKTTLAKKVYDHQNVRNHFDCHAWISVSQSYKIENLLRSMIQKFCNSRKESSPKGMDAMNEKELFDKAREYLQDKRYVVIFDDVWKTDFWGEIEYALLDINNGSRILITTRNMDVDDVCKESSPVFRYELQALTPDQAWELFCKKVFQFDSDPNCPSFLEKLSHDILDKCQGLPLAIVAIGGLLLTKDKNVYEWKKLYDSLGSELGENPHLTDVREILSLSYYDLPHYLKSCFLCFGMYPEDYSINCLRIIRHWIAEGFVQEREGKTLEEVAGEYLTELIHRSLVQISWVDLDGKVRTCQIHDLLRETVLQKMVDLNFCHVVSNEQSSFSGITRRLSGNKCLCEVLARFENSHIRCILFFLADVFPESSMDTIMAKFKLLKVLDFENVPLNHVPKDLGNLFHLRYLSLRNTKVKSLPKSIGNLQHLEALDLKQSLVREIPVEVNKLKKLRYLIAYYRDYSREFSLSWEKGVKIQDREFSLSWEIGTKMHYGIGNLEALQKLYLVDADHGGVDLIKELMKLKQLRKLGMLNLTRETEKVLCAAIEQLNQLRSLCIISISVNEIMDLQSISSPPQYLRTLYLVGHLEKLPNWISKLQNLVRLDIYWSKLSDDPMKTFQYLPNLLQLRITNEVYVGLQMHIEEGGFPKLKEIDLRDMNGLELLVINKGALPLLEYLCLGHFPQMKEVPSGIQHLRNLQKLFFYNMPTEFEENLDPKDGPHYSIIQHVPAVYFGYKTGPGQFDYMTRTLYSQKVKKI